MEASDADNPKLFKLTGAVTAIQPIIQAIQEVFARHPGKKAGVTLANSFPSLAFRPAAGRRWEEGVVIGMSGEGVLPISNLTLAKVSGTGRHRFRQRRRDDLPGRRQLPGAGRARPSSSAPP